MHRKDATSVRAMPAQYWPQGAHVLVGGTVKRDTDSFYKSVIIPRPMAIDDSDGLCVNDAA